MRGSFALAVALAAGGCSADFDPISYLDPSTLRVIAVVADPPEVAAGASTTITVIAPPLADGTPITYEWALCTQPPPPGTSDVDTNCLTLDTASFLIPIDSTSATATVTMPADTNPANLGIPDVTGGFYVPVRVRAHAGSQRVDTIYGLRLSLPQLPNNHNPNILNAELVSPPLDASPMQVTELSTDASAPTPVSLGSEPTVQLFLTPDSYEQFPELQGTPPNQKVAMVSEQPRFFWYADAGVITHDTTGQAEPGTQLKLDDKHPPSRGQIINLWVVVQDERGGAAYTHRFLVAQ
jgi:hypothetical protein